MESIMKNGKINHLGFFIQSILLILLLIFFVISLIKSEMYVVVKYLLSFILCTMAYNNYSIYRRKYFTSLYLIVGVVLLVSTTFNLIYG